LVASGEYARLEVSGADRFEQAARWWASVVNGLDVDDGVGVPGSGPVAFASFTFDTGPASSVVIVPRLIVGRRKGAAWVTTIGEPVEPAPADEPIEPIGQVAWSDGALGPAQWKERVAAAIHRIEAGELDKVVLARDLNASADADIDPRALLVALARDYPTCWTFAVDGLVGATPELLVRRVGDHLTSRVLAGSIERGADAPSDARRSATLSGSDKDHAEHQIAVRSVADALAPFAAELVVPRTPELLRLANVTHLMTDVTARLDGAETALDLVAALHPTAAVCGTPTADAYSLIRELEGMDRERYSGPVGWFDARGDGEFCIALRCARLSGRDVRLFAGCGIVAGSVPDAELAETVTKLMVIRNALESR
jgi:menaquinone-specific isochorismate synthase